MKAILEFNLPEEAEDHLHALNGIKYKIALDELDEWLRKLSKYEDKRGVKIDDVREKLRELSAD